jgi:hypothetical protein
MTPVLLLVAALQATTAVVVPVTFSPEGTGWALISNASGTANISDESLKIDIDQLKISRSSGTTGTIKLTSYRVCLAFQKTETVWDLASCSKPVKSKLSIKPTDVHSIAGSELEISTKDLPALNLFWLVIELEAPLKGRGVGHMYSRTRKDIFKTSIGVVPESGH